MYVEEDDLIELMLANRQAKILPRSLDKFKEFTDACASYNLSVPFELDSDQFTWNMPDSYSQLDIRSMLISKHELTHDQLARVDLELEEFKKLDLLDLLKFLTYLVDILRSNNIIYGVGRGSSIASYVLYLIGVHRINSYEFNLDIKEFLK